MALYVCQYRIRVNSTHGENHIGNVQSMAESVAPTKGCNPIPADIPFPIRGEVSNQSSSMLF